MSDHNSTRSSCNSPGIRVLAWTAVTALLIITAGCVTEIEKPLAKTALFTTQVGDQITLSWQSKIGEQYSIWYSEARDASARWNVLPGCERIAGTGEVIQKSDQVQNGVHRYYRIVISPAMK